MKSNYLFIGASDALHSYKNSHYRELTRQQSKENIYLILIRKSDATNLYQMQDVIC